MAELDWLDSLLKEKHPDIVAKREEEVAVLQKVAAAPKPTGSTSSGSRNASSSGITVPGKPGAKPAPAAAAGQKMSVQENLDFINSLFGTANTKGFNKQVYSKSTPQDLEFLVSEQHKLDDLWNATRRNLQAFFGASWSTESLILAKSDQISVKDLRNVKTQELLNLLKHRDENLQEKAVSVLASRCADPTDPIEKKAACDELVAEGGLRNLMTVLNSPRPMVILETLRCLSAVVSFPEHKEKIRAAGGLKPLIKLVLHPDLQTQLRTLTCLHHLAMPEKAREAMVSAGVVEPVVKALANPNLKVILLSIVVLQNLTGHHVKIQEEVVKARGLEPACLLTQHQNETMCIEAHKLLANLSHCATAKQEFPKNTLAALITELKPQEVYFNATLTDNKGPAHHARELVQLHAMRALEQLAQHEDQRKVMENLSATSKLLAYFRPPAAVHFDVFRWNFEVMLASLKVLLHHLNLRQSRIKFVESDGATILLKVLTLTELFPKPLIETCALVMSRVATSEELANAMVGSGITNLIKTLQSSPLNTTLQLCVVQTIKTLAQDDKNKQTIFEEGGIQLLNTLLKSPDVQVIQETMESLAILTHNKFIRKVLRLVGVSNLITLLAHSKEEISRPAALTMANLALDPEGVDAIMKDPSGAAVSALIGLLEHENPPVQEAAVTALDNLMITSDEAKNQFIVGGGVAFCVGAVGSPTESLQLRAMQLLTKLAKLPAAKPALDAAQLGHKLTALKDHENVKKEGSQVVQAYRTLIIAYKSLPSGGAAMAGGAGGVSASNYSADPEIDKILSKLTVPQLVTLCNNLAKAGNINLREFLMKKKDATSNAPASPGKAPPKGPSAKKAASKPGAKKVFDPTEEIERVQISAGDIVKAKDKLKITRRLMESGVAEGKRFWDGAVARWHEEFQAAISLEKNFLKVAYEVIEVKEYEMPWKRAMKLLNSDTMNEGTLADFLQKVGFGVKRAVYQTDKGQEIDYEAIILPEDLPIKFVLKAIVIATR